MIIDLERFLSAERAYWDELEQWLDRAEAHPLSRWTVEETRRFHYLYERAAADLDKVSTFSFEPETRRYLNALVGRAYGEIHEVRGRRLRVAPGRWFFCAFPRAFRRHRRAFHLATALALVGACLGAGAVTLDPAAKAVLMPAEHLMRSPSERVAEEERRATDGLTGRKATFSAWLMTHNIRVSIFSVALGMTAGLGTLLLVFYNGAMIGAIAADYLLAGEWRFLLGWLLPHGAVEIPAFLIAGQTGLLLGGALIGSGDRRGMRERLRQVSGDVATLIGGLAVLLVWAGLVEAFLSQYHEPVIAYEWKIALGAVECVLLAVFLSRAGRTPEER